MFPAHVGQKIGSASSASGFYVFVASRNTFNCLLKVLTLPFEVSGQDIVESSSGVLAMAVGVLLQLCLALGLQGHHFHNCSDTNTDSLPHYCAGVVGSSATRTTVQLTSLPVEPVTLPLLPFT